MDAHDSWSAEGHYAPLGELATAPVSPFTRTPSLTGGERVVAIGVLCDFTEEPTGGNPGLSISIFEHCVLDDGQTVHLSVRGFTHSLVHWTDGVTVETPADAERPSLESLRQDVLNCVLPDDLPDGSPPVEDHPWAELAGSAREVGVQVSADELRRLEYFVEFTERLEKWVSG
ncbi:hypothetical protein [Nesterenkonia sp. CF4.4]|uniref:hypothetical protein n=1 Tax=Nesterenkonia sp. CF4.4 TaxID=3373079 RepID=UPI003EE7D7FC